MRKFIRSFQLNLKVQKNFNVKVKNVYVQYLNQSSTIDQDRINKSTSKFQESSEFSQIHEWDDKFGLIRYSDPFSILAQLKESKYDYEFSDYMYFLTRVQVLANEQKKEQEVRLSNDFIGFVQIIKKKLQQSDHEKYPRLGSLALSFKKLGVQDESLWKLFENKFNEDEFYPNFKESVNAIEGMTQLKLFANQDRIDSVYKRIERVMGISIWEENMTVYERLLTSMTQVNRIDEKIYQKIEEKVLSNLAMDYELDTMLSILLSYSKSNRGSKQFYDAMQNVMFKGHMLNMNPLLHGRMDLPYSSRIGVQLLEAYTNIQQKHHNFILSPDFKLIVYKLLTSKHTKFDAGDAAKALKYLPHFKYEEQKEMNQIIINKLIFNESPNKHYYSELIELVEVTRDLNIYDQKIGNFVTSYFLKDIGNEIPQNTVQMYDYLLFNNLIDNKKKQEIILKLVSQVNQNMMKFNLHEINYVLGIMDSNKKDLQLLIDNNQDQRQIILENQVQDLQSLQKKMKDFVIIKKFQQKEELKRLIN